ncbi:MAG: SRPBCC domain-containing protein [Chloroflexi bacterium]|nr:SRPBCC domain-containing protein [Chloroflexota bacterium]
MNKIEQSYIIPATPEQVWRALTEPELIEEWSGADAEFDPTVGGVYSLWDGSISGEIIEVAPRKKLVQSWKPDDWTIENSIVTFTLSSVSKGTRVDLVHENIEDFDFEGTTEGWDSYYLGAIKRMFEANTKVTKGNAKKTTTKARTKKAKGTKGAKKITAKARTKNVKAAKKGKVVAKNKVAAKKTSKKRK